MSQGEHHETADDIAVVGMVCRLPGARDVAEYWRNLAGGVESIRFYSEAELERAGVDRDLLRRPNYVCSAGGVLDDIDQFDASFFGMSPREAQVLDPQHRLFLESCHAALESAGHDPSSFTGPIAVFAGAGRAHYLIDNLLSHPEILKSIGAVEATLASDRDFLPARVAYQLDLHGPAINVQTACSTSLVATHLASQSLLAGECDLAIAGGVSITSLRPHGYLYEEGSIYSPDGHCRAFDADAVGMVGGDGLALVVLRRLHDAIEDGDTVHAVIKGSAINNDGSDKVGFTAPGVEGQSRVISEALAVAGVDPETIGYVEAHGTGTPLGDPIEIAALTQAYRAHTERRGYCAIGSVKTNIGHTNSAAGCAGLIKSILSIKHGKLLPSLNFRTANPEIDFASSPFHVSREAADWKTDHGPRRAGVSSFGMGGTNAHVIVEQAPAVPPAEPGRAQQLLVLSAKTATALASSAARLADHFSQHPDIDLADAAFTLQAGRRSYSHRRIVVASDPADAAVALRGRDRAFDAQQDLVDRPVAFLFPGQGSQYVGMGSELYDAEPVFRRALDRCAEILEPILGLDVRGLLYPRDAGDRAAEKLAQTAVTQPVTFAVEYALAQLWSSFGVRPAALVGHSVGEWVAATLAGIFDLEDALALVAARGRLMQQQPPGDMLSVALAESALQPLLTDNLAIAAVNGPELCVAAGPGEAVAALRERLTADGVDTRMLRTSHAFHSSMMEPAVMPFLDLVDDVGCRPPRIPCYSTVTGALVDPAEWSTPAYWARNLREPVRFADATRQLLEAQPHMVLLEVGPGQVLCNLVRQHGALAGGRAIVSSMRRPDSADSDVAVLLEGVGRVWLGGGAVDPRGVHGGRRRRRIPLPTYPFEHKRYWIDAGGDATGAVAPAVRLGDVGAWSYVPSWQRQPVSPPAPATRWLLLVRDAELEALARTLPAGAAVVVRPGTAFEQAADGSYRLRPDEPADFSSLFSALAADGCLPDRIVHGWCALPSSADAHTLGFAALLAMAQAWGEVAGDHRVHLDVVARYLFDVTGGEATGAARATMLGPVRVAPLEMPLWTARLIDVDRDAALVTECHAAATAPVVVWRGPHRWVPEPARAPLPPAAATAPWRRRRATYVITGGLGGVGAELAELLAESGEVRLVLVGRTPLPEPESRPVWLAERGEDDPISRRIRRFERLSASAAEVAVEVADVADRAAMAAVVERTLQRFGPVHGVIHAAGSSTGALIATRRASDAAAVLAPKVDGTLVLAELLAEQPLDFFVSCSSIAALQGGVGAADYCGANAFLDALPFSADRVAGVPFVTVSWDAWRDTGMAAETEVPAELRAARARELELGIGSAEGRDALARVLSSGEPHVIVSTRALAPRLAAPESVAEPAAATAASFDQSRPDLSTPYEAPETDTQKAIANAWRELLGVATIGVHDNFFELGGHSLMAARVTARLQDELGVHVPVRQLLESPTVSQLAAFVEVTQWARDGEHPAAATADEEEFEL